MGIFVSEGTGDGPTWERSKSKKRARPKVIRSTPLGKPDATSSIANVLGVTPPLTRTSSQSSRSSQGRMNKVKKTGMSRIPKVQDGHKGKSEKQPEKKVTPARGLSRQQTVQVENQAGPSGQSSSTPAKRAARSRGSVSTGDGAKRRKVEQRPHKALSRTRSQRQASTTGRLHFWG